MRWAQAAGAGCRLGLWALVPMTSPFSGPEAGALAVHSRAQAHRALVDQAPIVAECASVG
jgi:hypothetical protein